MGKSKTCAAFWEAETVTYSFNIYLQYCGTFVAAVMRRHPAVLGRVSGVKDGCYAEKLAV